MAGAGIERAHVVGLSMGAFATLHFGLDYPEQALSLVAAGVGYGAEKTREAEFRQGAELARAASRPGAAVPSPRSTQQRRARAVRGQGPPRLARVRRPAGGAFAAGVRQHDARRAGETAVAVRPRGQFKQLALPTLIVAGDEDDNSLQPSLFLKLTIPACGLLVLPKTGHTINLEEPDLFNRAIADFLAQVAAGRWRPRDPRARPDEILKLHERPGLPSSSSLSSPSAG